MDLKKSFCQQLKIYLVNAFKLTTHKVAVIGILLALTTLISLLEIPTFFVFFLKFDFGNTMNLIAVIIIKLPYGLIIAVITPWLRLVLPHTGNNGDVIGELAYMLSTISFLLIYSAFHVLFKQITLWKDDSVHTWKRLLLIEVPVAIITCLSISFVNTFYNWAFILDLYGAGYLKNQLWVLFLPYNLFKFTLILGLYLLLIRPVQVLKYHFNL